ncbi:hypothetical protein [Pseudonocardia sp. H11422]|nr:hypothetical protein [Pseudonocardia sp. H11422]
MTDTPRVWLTSAAYERLKIELSGLLARNHSGLGPVILRRVGA